MYKREARKMIISVVGISSSTMAIGEVVKPSFPGREVIKTWPYVGLVALPRHGRVDNPGSERAKNLQKGEENGWSGAKT